MSQLVSAGGHLMPFFLERGFSATRVWPRRTPNPPGPPSIGYETHGNVYWHDPAELVYSLALAYPYLDGTLQQQTRAYVSAAIARYPPLDNLPWNGLPWLRQGVAREPYAVPFRASLSSWPPPGADLNALTALWLWAKVTNDWTYASASWTRAKQLFEAHRTSMDYYADIGGAIAYARLARRFGDAAAEQAGVAAATAAMEAGRDFERLRSRADAAYPDARNQITGWYAPVFYGITPEVGLYLRDEVAGAQTYLQQRVAGNGLRWWYLTRAGAHAEVGETSFVSPMAGWSYFMAHAYLAGSPRTTLERWLDRPWARGDLFSIQKIVATIQAPASAPAPSYAAPLARP